MQGAQEMPQRLLMDECPASLCALPLDLLVAGKLNIIRYVGDCVYLFLIKLERLLPSAIQMEHMMLRKEVPALPDRAFIRAGAAFAQPYRRALL